MKYTLKLRQIRILKPLFKVRDSIMEATGLFKLKAKIKQRIFFRRLLKEDARKKQEIEKKINQLPKGFLDSSKLNDNDIIISLTSYGKRVEDTLPYTLYSLLIQTVMPKKIAVFLDNDNWNDGGDGQWNLGLFDGNASGQNYGGETMSYGGGNIPVTAAGTCLIELDLSNPRAYTYTATLQYNIKIKKGFP